MSNVLTLWAECKCAYPLSWMSNVLTLWAECKCLPFECQMCYLSYVLLSWMSNVLTLWAECQMCLPFELNVKCAYPLSWMSNVLTLWAECQMCLAECQMCLPFELNVKCAYPLSWMSNVLTLWVGCHHHSWGRTAGEHQGWSPPVVHSSLHTSLLHSPFPSCPRGGEKKNNDLFQHLRRC